LFIIRGFHGGKTPYHREAVPEDALRKFEEKLFFRNYVHAPELISYGTEMES